MLKKKKTIPKNRVRAVSSADVDTRTGLSGTNWELDGEQGGVDKPLGSINGKRYKGVLSWIGT